MVWGSFPFYTEDEICCNEVNLDFDITPECKDIIRKCLKKCPKERPSLLELFDTPFVKQTKINEGNEDLTNFPVPGTSASSNSFSGSNLTHSEDLSNLSPNSFIVSNLESEDLTNASNLGISATPNSFIVANLESEDLTNTSNPELSATPNSFSGSNLSSENLTNASNLGPSASFHSFSASNLTRTEDLKNAVNSGTSANPNSFKGSNLTRSKDLNNTANSGTSATPNSHGDTDLTSTAKAETSATPNSLSDSYLTNVANQGILETPNSLIGSNLTQSVQQNVKEELFEDHLIKAHVVAGEKRKCETTQIQTDFELDANTETTIKRKKQGIFKSFENQTDAVEAAFMFHEKESRKGQKNTKKEKKRSRSR